MNIVKILFGAVIVSLILATPPATAANSLTIVINAGSTGAPETVLVETAHDLAVAEIEIVEVALENGHGEFALQLEQQGTWRLRASAPGFWSPEVSVAAPFLEPVELTLWPAVAVSAVVSTPEDSDPPDTVQLTMNQIPELPIGAPKQPEKAAVRCSITERRLAGCEVPAGLWHIRIKAAKYVPIYHWNLKGARHLGIDVPTPDPLHSVGSGDMWLLSER